jgi:hypothetical protein
MAYIIIDEQSYEIDTDEQEAIARAALCDAGIEYADVWNGSPDCPDSYKSSTNKLFAASPIEIGDKVQPKQGTCADEDMEPGKVLEVEGDMALVGWESGVRTMIELVELEVVEASS